MQNDKYILYTWEKMSGSQITTKIPILYFQQCLYHVNYSTTYHFSYNDKKIPPFFKKPMAEFAKHILNKLAVASTYESVLQLISFWVFVVLSDSFTDTDFIWGDDWLYDYKRIINLELPPFPRSETQLNVDTSFVLDANTLNIDVSTFQQHDNKKLYDTI